MAKKRYYQSRKDRKNESRGMKKAMAKKSPMLSEDYSQPSHLPREVIYKAYSKCDYLNQDGYPDTYRDTEMQINDDVRGARKQRSRTKY